MITHPQNFGGEAGAGGIVQPVPASTSGYLSEGRTEGSRTSGGLGASLRLLWRHKFLLLCLAILGLLFGVLLSAFQAPAYRSRTLLEIQTLNHNFLDAKNVAPLAEGDPGSNSMDLQTQVALLQSDALIKRAVSRVSAQQPSRAHLRSGWLGGLRQALHLSSADPAVDRSPAAVAGNLKVKVIGQTRLIEITFSSPDSGFSSRFLNGLTQEFIESGLEGRLDMSRRTNAWLSGQLAEMRANLERSDETLQSYAQRSGLLFTTERVSVSSEKLRQLQEELSKAQGDRVTKQSLWESARSSPPDALPAVIDNSAFRSLQDKMTELRRQRAEMIAIYTAKHSKVQRIEAQMAPLETALQEQRSATVAKLRSEYESALRRETLLSAAFGQQSGLVTAQDQKSIRYNILKREVESNRQLYDAMLQHVREASVASAMQASNVRIVDPAEPNPVPYKPNPAVNCAMGLFTGFCLGAAVLVFKQAANRSIQSPGDAANFLNVPELAAIPSLEGARDSRFHRYLPDLHGTRDWKAADGTLGLSGPNRIELVAAQAQPSALGESFRAALASILLSAYGQRPAVILVTSPGPGEGKTTIAANLALGLAAIGRNVLLIDGDLWKPRLHEIFEVSNERGLSDYLLDDGESQTANWVPTKYPRLSLVPAGSASCGSSSGQLYSVRMANLLTSARAVFDTVLIDTPPVLDISDARVIGALADGAVVVIRSAETTREAALAATQRLTRDGTKILGVILNSWNPKNTRIYDNQTSV